VDAYYGFADFPWQTSVRGEETPMQCMRAEQDLPLSFHFQLKPLLFMRLNSAFYLGLVLK
jgi:hypothetical protein